MSMRCEDTPLSSRRRVEEFAESRGLVVGAALGAGTDGFVWRIGKFLVIKSFSRREAFDREVAAYQRLQERSVSEITVDSRFTFAIPRLIEIDRPRLLLVMTFVFPPYVLDFGKCYVDHTPDYSEEVIAETEEAAAELFGRRWRIVQKVLSRMRAFGIYYVDAKPGNIEFREDD